MPAREPPPADSAPVVRPATPPSQPAAAPTGSGVVANGAYVRPPELLAALETLEHLTSAKSLSAVKTPPVVGTPGFEIFEHAWAEAAVRLLAAAKERPEFLEVVAALKDRFPKTSPQHAHCEKAYKTHAPRVLGSAPKGEDRPTAPAERGASTDRGPASRGSTGRGNGAKAPSRASARA